MRIFDPNMLYLPFYEEEHRVLASRLEAWVVDHWALQEEDKDLCPRERCRRYTKKLGKDHWFQSIIQEQRRHWRSSGEPRAGDRRRGSQLQ